jgi:hypothetical protein
MLGGPPKTAVTSRKTGESTKQRQREQVGRMERKRKSFYQIRLTSQAQEDLETYREIKRTVKREVINRKNETWENNA